MPVKTARPRLPLLVLAVALALGTGLFVGVHLNGALSARAAPAASRSASR